MSLELREMIFPSPSTVPIHDESDVLEHIVYKKYTASIVNPERKAIKKIEICFFDKDE